MAIIAYTPRPRALLKAIVEAVDDGEVGGWERDGDGDFARSADGRNRVAWLRPRPGEGVLQLSFVVREGTTVTDEMYGFYHAAFVQLLLTHFNEDFSALTVTVPQEDEEGEEGEEEADGEDEDEDDDEDGDEEDEEEDEEDEDEDEDEEHGEDKEDKSQ